jgi:hypothetical protein
MLNLSTLLRRVTAIALLVGGCHGLPLVAPGATVVTYPSFERSDCSLNLNRSFPGGTLLIDSEESFRAHFACRGSSENRVESGSGVDFSRDLVVVFLADGKSRAPKLVRIERKGDRLTAIFSVEPYCGGAPPFPTTAVHPFLVRRASLSLESKVVTLSRFKSCPKDLP